MIKKIHEIQMSVKAKTGKDITPEQILNVVHVLAVEFDLYDTVKFFREYKEEYGK